MARRPSPRHSRSERPHVPNQPAPDTGHDRPADSRRRGAEPRAGAADPAPVPRLDRDPDAGRRGGRGRIRQRGEPALHRRGQAHLGKPRSRLRPHRAGAHRSGRPDRRAGGGEPGPGDDVARHRPRGDPSAQARGQPRIRPRRRRDRPGLARPDDARHRQQPPRPPGRGPGARCLLRPAPGLSGGQVAHPDCGVPLEDGQAGR